MARFDSTDAFDVAQRFAGTKEVGGSLDNPMILAMLDLDVEWGDGELHDEVPWCSAFMNYVCWLMRLPRSKSLRARSWLRVGHSVPLSDAQIGDIVVLQRGSGDQPGVDVIDAPGHVGFYAGINGEWLEVLGGNQSDTVKVSRYPKSKLLSIRRID